MSINPKVLVFQGEFFKNELIHLNNAGLQPIPLRTKNRIDYWSRRFWEEGFNTDADYALDIQKTRERLARLLKCTHQEVCFFTSTSGAINQIAFGLDLRPDDEVITLDQEYGSHIYPWKAACDLKKSKLVILESGPELQISTAKIKDAINNKTKVLALSWVQFQNGAQIEELKELIQYAKSKNIFVSIDIIQGFGWLECDLWSYGVDALMGGSHKWLFSPVGVGFLALRLEHISKIKPHVIGAYTYGTCDDPSDLFCSPKKDALRYEPGSKQVLEITALGASLSLLEEIGADVIGAEALKLARKLDRGLTQLGYKVIKPLKHQDDELQAPFVNFLPADPSRKLEISQKLKEQKIFHAIRGPGLRFTTQAFNSEHEIDYVLEYMKSL